MNGSEPSPGSEQIEHTKTECLYAKLCEREGNPRQLVSGSYQLGDSTPDWSDSEHTQSSPHPAPLPRRGKRRNITSSPSGANFDGHAESQTQCPCEGLTIQGAHSAEQTIKYRLREEVKIQDRGKQTYEQQRITDAGEGWQNQNHVNDNNKINCHPEETQCPKDLRVPKDSSVVLLPQNDDNSIKTSF